MPRLLLLVGNHKNDLRSLRQLLQQDGYDILTADSGRECLRLLTEHGEAQVVVASQSLPDTSGEELLTMVREIHPETMQLLLIDQVDVESDTDRSTALRYLPHPWNDEIMRRRIREAFRFQELIRTNSQLTRFLAAAGDAIVITDARGIMQSVNPAFSKLSGYEPEELLGFNVRELLAGADQTRFDRKILLELARTGQWHGDMRQRRKDGIEADQRASIHAVREAAGEISQLVFSFFCSEPPPTGKVRRSADRTYFDRLTALPNRLLFSDRVEMALAQAKRNGNMVGVILLDMDRFKIVNDTLGYKTGDEVLREAAGRLSAHTRREDTVARLGGDQFVLLMPRLSRIEDIVTFNRKLLEVFKAPFVVSGHELRVSPSLGISLYPDNGSRAETLIKNADTAMGWAKEQGGNCYCFYTPTLHATAFKRLTLVNNLHRALEKNQFVLHFQPQIDLATGGITGAEALVRWQSPELGMVPPSQFIPVAEESGLIVPIGAWTLHSACLHGNHWYGQGHTTLRVAVNLSARLFAEENLLTMIEEVLAETGLPPFCLDLEITETILMQNAAATVAILDRLKAMGIQISMDDFGTGYSSLSYLKRFPIDALKIDKSFVKDVTSNPDDAAIVTAIVAMAKSLKIRVIAEGVETQEQAAFLRELGCHRIQGFLISPAVPATEFERMVAVEKDKGPARQNEMTRKLS